MEKYNECLLCKSENIVDLYTVKSFTFSKCKDCTLCFIREILSDKYLKNFYIITPEQKEEMKEVDVYFNESNMKNLDYTYKSVANRIHKEFSFSQANNKRRLLDLGCSSGGFFKFFPDWDVYGIEIEEEVGNIAKAKYENVFVGDMKDANFEENFFDCITIQDALDHSNNPSFVVSNCYKLLKDDGIIIIKVHNINCFLARITGKKFYAIIPPSHLTYFNKNTLKKILSDNGFEYINHYYNTQKLMLCNAIMRASVTFPFIDPVQRFLKKTIFGKLPFYKNFHDIITIMGRKKSL